MENKLSQKELLQRLIDGVKSPFCTTEKQKDIKKILMTSSNFEGMNHLFLVSCYLSEGTGLFQVSEEEAFTQAELALKEKNPIAYYAFYELYKMKDPHKAKAYLMISCDTGYVKAYLTMARLLEKAGSLSPDGIDAYHYYALAAEEGSQEGYYGMLLLDQKNQDYGKAKNDYEKARKAGVLLPGTVL